MFSKRSIIYCVLTIAALVYLAVMLPLTSSMAAADTLCGPRILLDDSTFINRAAIIDVMGLTDEIGHASRADVNLQEIENRLNSSDKIEHANVSVSPAGALCVDVEPMVPVARVYGADGSYYINAQGKRIKADPRYHIDVPLVSGHFTKSRPPERLLPLLETISRDKALDALVSTLVQTRKGDIIVIPTIRGHVVNLGDTADIADKFARLRTFYRRVMPVKGWTFYDTVSVKWAGRVVATRRGAALSAPSLPLVEEYDEVPELDIDFSEVSAGVLDDTLFSTKFYTPRP